MENLCDETTKSYQKDNIKQYEDFCKEVTIADKNNDTRKIYKKIESITGKFKINHTTSVNKLDGTPPKDNQ